MSKTPPELRELAAAQFEEPLAQEVQQAIDAESGRVAGRMPAPGCADTTQPTGFLGDLFYDALIPGRFSGNVSLRWNGMDRFVYLPDPQDPLTYISSTGRVIAPRLMYTDGGSTPRVLRGFKKYSSWGYAPAFMIHDWLFTARRCGHAPDEGWSFTEAALVMAEAMKSLMIHGFVDYEGKTVVLDKAEDTLLLMYLGVLTSQARRAWDGETGACAGNERSCCLP